MKLARVFPSRTTYTPTDVDAYYGPPPMFSAQVYDQVHVSCVFTWDKPWAENLAKQWRAVCPNVQVGGPAYNAPGGEFMPGLYLKPGFTMTSRGCPNSCAHCLVPKREGKLRQLEIKPGHIILDNNLLACSKAHVSAVFSMLSEQGQPACFTGGLEAARVSDWVVEQLRGIKLGRLFMAYDRPNEERPLQRALAKLCPHFHRRKLKVYVLVGFEGDTLQEAEARCVRVWELGGLPFAMFYRDPEGKNQKTEAWGQFQAIWTRPPATYHRAAMLGLPDGAKTKRGQDQLEFLHVKNRGVPHRFMQAVNELDGVE